VNKKRKEGKGSRYSSSLIHRGQKRSFSEKEKKKSRRRGAQRKRERGKGERDVSGRPSRISSRTGEKKKEVAHLSAARRKKMQIGLTAPSFSGQIRRRGWRHITWILPAGEGEST